VQPALFTLTDAALLVTTSGPMAWRYTARKRRKACWCRQPLLHSDGRIVGDHTRHDVMPPPLRKRCQARWRGWHFSHALMAALSMIISGPMAWRCTVRKRGEACWSCQPVSHANGRIVGDHIRHDVMPPHLRKRCQVHWCRWHLYTHRCCVVGDQLRPDSVALHRPQTMASLPVLPALFSRGWPHSRRSHSARCHADVSFI